MLHHRPCSCGKRQVVRTVAVKIFALFGRGKSNGPLGGVRYSNRPKASTAIPCVFVAKAWRMLVPAQAVKSSNEMESVTRVTCPTVLSEYHSVPMKDNLFGLTVNERLFPVCNSGILSFPAVFIIIMWCGIITGNLDVRSPFRLTRLLDRQ